MLIGLGLLAYPQIGSTHMFRFSGFKFKTLKIHFNLKKSRKRCVVKVPYLPEEIFNSGKLPIYRKKNRLPPTHDITLWFFSSYSGGSIHASPSSSSAGMSSSGPTRSISTGTKPPTESLYKREVAQMMQQHQQQQRINNNKG